MLTSTSLRHPSIRCRLHGAMIRAASESRLHRIGVHNAGSILVSHKRDRMPAYKFLHQGKDITATVLAELRQPMPSNRATFELGHSTDKLWNQPAKVYEWGDVIYTR